MSEAWTIPPPAAPRGRRWLIALVIVVPLLLIGGVVAAVVSGDSYSGTKPVKWMSTVCGATADWRDKNAQLQKDFLAKTASVHDPVQLRDLLVSYIGDVTRAADDLASRVDNLDKPAAANGSQVQRDLAAALRANRENYDRFRNDAQSLPVGRAEDFSTGAKDLGTRIDSSGTKVGTDIEHALTRLRVTAATNRQIERDPNCKRLG